MDRSDKIFKNVDWLILFILILLIVIGEVNIFSSEYNGSLNRFFNINTNFTKQLIYLAPALIIFGLIFLIDGRFFINLSFWIYAFTLFLLILTLLMGRSVAGSRSWISIGMFNLQASEFAKFGTALALAKYLDLYNINVSRFKDSMIAFLIILLPFGLIMLQNDFGSAVVFLAFIFLLFREGLSPLYLYLPLLFCFLFLAVLIVNVFWVIIALVIIATISYLFLYGKKKSLIIILFALGSSIIFVLSGNFVFNNVLEPHQRSRINVLLGKDIDLKGTGYNVHQSLIAVGSGGFLGKGFLKGTQTKLNFVPEQSTDFIFCTIGEEYGFIGSTILLILFSGLILRIIYLSEKQKYRFVRLYGYGIMSVIFLHFVVNIAMTIGLFPVIGIPLPLVSYGGSSLISFLIMIAIFLKLDADYKHYFS